MLQKVCGNTDHWAYSSKKSARTQGGQLFRLRLAAWGTTLILTGFFVACSHQSKLVEKVEAFRAVRKAGKIEEAQRYLTDDPRVWFDKKEGEGKPMKLGFGPYHHWDEEFHSHGEHGPWKVEGNTVWAIATEINDYYRLVERKDTPTYRITYFFNDKGLIEGYLISDAHPGEPSPPKQSREEEFKKWAQETYPEEWHYLRPEGKLDPSEDRAERTRALLVEWRSVVGLPPLPVESDNAKPE